MCLIAVSCRLKANTDLKVYKLLNRDSYLGQGCYHTPYIGYIVRFIINTVEMNSNLEVPTKNGILYVGIHAYTELPYYTTNKSSKFFYAVIPKGSELYFGCNGEIASDRLIIFESKKAYLEYKKTHKVVSAEFITSNFSKELFNKRNIIPSISL